MLHNGSYHRIIVPIYVPHTEGYFEQSLQILRACLQSIERTKHARCAVTVIDNGSCPEAKSLIEECVRRGAIHQVVKNLQNRGKIDAAIGVFRACHEDLVTISDADVLFLPGWIEAVENVFNDFPQAGLVSPCPIPSSWSFGNSATLLSGCFRRLLRSRSLIDEPSLKMFADSIGRNDLYVGKEYLLMRQIVLEKNQKAAIIGCGHFVATLRREVLRYIPTSPSLSHIGNMSEKWYIDQPVDAAGFWRLGTPGVFAHHMGNVFEPWMEAQLKEIEAAKPAAARRVAPARRDALHLIPYWLRSRVMWKVLHCRPLRRVLLRSAKIAVDVKP